MSRPGIGHNGAPLEGAVHASQFARRFAEVEMRLPKAAREKIRRAAQRRLAERWAAGRGETPLCFDDLAEAIEDALMGRANDVLKG
jgi:hypothetical protein